MSDPRTRSITAIASRHLTAVSFMVMLTLLILPGYAPRVTHGATLRRVDTGGTAVLTVAGHGNRTTRTVAVPGRWTLRWSYKCTGRRRFEVTAYRSGQHAPVARMTKRRRAGHGTLHVLVGGRVHLIIRSGCSWHVTIARPLAPHPAPSATPTAAPSPTAAISPPTATSGPVTGDELAVHVSGNRVVNQDGQAIRLIGVNVPASAQCTPTGPHTPPGIFAFPSATQTAAAVASWHVNVVRVTLNEDCWLGINGGDPAYTGANYRTAITDFVAALHAVGLYVILDLHANAPGALPSSSAQVMADADHALTFWTSVAATFKDDPAVIFEPYNEPHITTANAQTSNPWQCWLNGCTIKETDQFHDTPLAGAIPWQSAGMQTLVDTIRATGATNPILIDGLNWSQDDTRLLQYLPTDPQHGLIADYHNYMSAGSKNTLTYWNTTIAPIAQRMPLITSEIGEKDCGSSYVTQYMDWADSHDIGYLPWVWMTWDCSPMGLVADWNGTPSAYGRTFYDHFHAIGFDVP